MSKYLKLDIGDHTTGDDPLRGIWYAHCGYWTDDWSKLLVPPDGIPLCPTCGCPGMQTTAMYWLVVDKRFLATHPRYDEWLRANKEQCGKSVSPLLRYKKWFMEVTHE